MTKHKALQGVEIKDAVKGTVEAVFARYNVKDSDNDVTLPGAFDDGAAVRISAYGHASWGPSRGASFVPILPVGKGVIRTTKDDAILVGQFFSNPTARETFEVVKEMGDLQEWSYGYDTLDSEKGKFEGEQVNFLKKQLVHEVSPVMLGAGVGTRTLSVKGKKDDSDFRVALEVAGHKQFSADHPFVYLADVDEDNCKAVFSLAELDDEPKYMQIGYSVDDDGAVALDNEDAEVRLTVDFVPKGATFADDHSHALASVDAFVTRSRSLADLRAKEGRVLSAANRERLVSLADALGVSAAAISELLAESDPNKHRTELEREFLRFERARAHI